jgi:hypothetical protein
MRSGDVSWLSREQRVERAGLLSFHQRSHEELRAKPQPVPKTGPGHCLGCLIPMPAGELVCGYECDDLAWRLTPTGSGSLSTEMPAYNVSGPKGRQEIDYGVVTTSSPLRALHQVHVEGLGPGRVRVAGDRLARNGKASGLEIMIPSS